jgi:drug/metabolite transporter (DMT)-like permease
VTTAAEAQGPVRTVAARATAMVVSSAAAFAAIAIFVVFATGAGAPLLAVLAWRYLLAAAALVPLAFAIGGARFGAAELRVVLVGGVGQSLVAVTTLVALSYIPAATLSFLFYTYPGWVAIISRVRHSEPLTPVRLVALAMSLTGIFVMVGAPGATSLHPTGVILALVGALLYAFYVPMIAELQRNLTPVTTAASMAAGAAIILFVVAVARGEMAFAMHRTAWISIVGLALISTVGAFLLFLRGLSVLGPVRTAIISTVEPFFTAVLGAWLLAQPMTATTLLGGALIAGAVILLQLPTGNNHSGRS